MAECRRMGFDFGLQPDSGKRFKQKNRWLFEIAGISADKASVFSLPPSKGARPSLSFKEINVEHLNETIYLPGKPEWKAINLTLYDLSEGLNNPIFNWIKKIYDSESGNFFSSTAFKKPNAVLRLYDGCGEILESWTFQSIWPQNIEFGDLDMDASDVVMCELTLRYDRAYIGVAKD